MAHCLHLESNGERKLENIGAIATNMNTQKFDGVTIASYEASYLAQDLRIPHNIFNDFSIKQYDFFNQGYAGYKRTLGYDFVALSSRGILYLEFDDGTKQSVIALSRNGNISETTIN
jgi:hypothetical protein